MKYSEKKITLKDGTNCVLRSVKIDDAEAMIEYLMKIAEETYFLMRYPEEVITDIKKEEEILEEILSSSRDIMITAFINDEVAGNTAVRAIGNHLKTNHRCGFGIAIKEKYWNRGLGNILLEEAISIAKEMGYEQMELGVFSDNHKAKKLYEKYGFEVWGVAKNAFKLKDGTYRDDIEMGRML